jgi:prevent-host-death family protein
MARQDAAAEATWTLQDAKNRFSTVVEAARRGKPQLVTRRGTPAVVVVAAEDFARLRRLENAAQPSFVDHLLAMPRDDEEFERLDANPRAADF